MGSHILSPTHLDSQTMDLTFTFRYEVTHLCANVGDENSAALDGV